MQTNSYDLILSFFSSNFIHHLGRMQLLRSILLKMLVYSLMEALSHPSPAWMAALDLWVWNSTSQWNAGLLLVWRWIAPAVAFRAYPWMWY